MTLSEEHPGIPDLSVTCVFRRAVPRGSRREWGWPSPGRTIATAAGRRNRARIHRRAGLAGRRLQTLGTYRGGDAGSRAGDHIATVFWWRPVQQLRWLQSLSKAPEEDLERDPIWRTRERLAAFRDLLELGATLSR